MTRIGSFHMHYIARLTQCRLAAVLPPKAATIKAKLAWLSLPAAAAVCLAGGQCFMLREGVCADGDRSQQERLASGQLLEQVGLCTVSTCTCRTPT
jgi:hypothetical protein